MLFYANSLIVIEFCHDSIKKINFLYFRCSKNCLFDFSLYLCPQNHLIVMDYDILQSVSQGSNGAQDAENSRIEAISDELKRRCKLYEAQLGDGQPHVALLKSSSALPNHLPRNTVCGYR